MKSASVFVASLVLAGMAVWTGVSSWNSTSGPTPGTRTPLEVSQDQQLSTPITQGRQDAELKPVVQTPEDAQKSLESLRRVNDHPFFEMHYIGDYEAGLPIDESALIPAGDDRQWACSIFVSYGKDGEAIYGRNFDWFDHPAMLLHTNPPDGYASISMVDVSYLGYDGDDEKFKTLEGRKALLAAPLLPFDGMNEHGLTVGMAAVGDSRVPNDPARKSVGSLQIIRLMLDGAKTVEEALKIFDRYNVVNRGGPNIHYLIADADGQSVLIELMDGQKNVIPLKGNWQSATNFYLTGQDKPLKQCWRFARIHERMTDQTDGLDVDQTFQLLQDVAQKNTQWSVAYDMEARTAVVSTDRQFDQRTTFRVRVGEDQE